MPVKLSPHQKAGHCRFCDDGATENNHCSWCGSTFRNPEHLADHLERSDCAAQIADALDLPEEK
jgi:hypothetical protein